MINNAVKTSSKQYHVVTVKLYPGDIQEIRQEYRKGCIEYGQRALARRYGVSQAAVRNIIHGRA